MRKVQWFLVALFIFGVLACASDPVPPDFPGHGGVEADPPDDTPEAVPPGFTSDRANRIFHREDCPLLEGVPRRNQEHFENPWQALNEGYAPCSTCEPQAGWR